MSSRQLHYPVADCRISFGDVTVSEQKLRVYVVLNLDLVGRCSDAMHEKQEMLRSQKPVLRKRLLEVRLTFFQSSCIIRTIHRMNVKLGGINVIPDPTSVRLLTDPATPTIVMGKFTSSHRQRWHLKILFLCVQGQMSFIQLQAPTVVLHSQLWSLMWILTLRNTSPVRF